MKKVLLLVSLALSLLHFSGCASGPGFAEMKDAIPQLAPDKGRVYFYRPSAFGAAVQPKVRLDGQEVGTAKSHGFFYVDVAPGNHVVETTTEVNRRLTFMIDPGQTRYVKLNISIGFAVGHVYPELVDNAEGEKGVAACKYTGGATAARVGM